MQESTWKFFKNALSNVVTGGASALLAIALPHYFVRCFRPGEFSLWVLVLQLAAYVNFLNFGIQTAVGRYVAHALGRNDPRHAEQIVGAGLQILGALACLAVVSLSVVALFFPRIFGKVDPAMVGTARQMLFWIGGALAVGLPASVFGGVFMGLQRNEVPAVSTILSKGLMAVALIWVGERTHSLIAAAQVYFAISVAGYALQFIWFRVVCREWHIHPLIVPAAARRELVSYCASLTVWSISMFLVNGMDTTIVGVFDFKDVAAYGISAGLVALFAGFLAAASNPLLQVFAKLHARNQEEGLILLLDFTSWTVGFLAISAGIVMVLPSSVLFRLWVGSGLGSIGVKVFEVLVLANGIRMLCAPYANYLVAAGLQRKVYLSPFAEGVTNLVVSILAARHFGAIGVAWGTVVGGVVGISANYVYNFPRTLPSQLSIGRMFTSNIFYPLMAALPLLALLALSRFYHFGLLWSAPLALVLILPGVYETLRRYRVATGLMAAARVNPHSDRPASVASVNVG